MRSWSHGRNLGVQRVNTSPASSQIAVSAPTIVGFHHLSTASLCSRTHVTNVGVSLRLDRLLLHMHAVFIKLFDVLGGIWPLLNARLVSSILTHGHEWSRTWRPAPRGACRTYSPCRSYWKRRWQPSTQPPPTTHAGCAVLGVALTTPQCLLFAHVARIHWVPLHAASVGLRA